MRFHIFRDSLGDEKKALVQIEVFVIVRLRVLQKTLGIEGPGGVDQVFDVIGLIFQLFDEPINLIFIIQVDGSCLHRTVCFQFSLGISQFFYVIRQQHHLGATV